MKRLFSILLLLPALAFGQANVIRNLQLQGNANGATNSWTNLTDVVLSSGVRLSTVASGGITNLVTSGTVTGSLNLSSGTLSLTGTATSGAGTLSGAYSTSALLTLAVSGTNVVGGLSSAVATGGQWNASVAAVGLVASNAVASTGGVYSVAAELQMLFPDDSGLIMQYDGTNSGINLIAVGSGVGVGVGGITLSSTAPIDLNGSRVSIQSPVNLAGNTISNGAFVGNASGLTNLPIYATGATVTQTSTGTVLTITGGGGAQSPWTNTVNAAGYSLTNALQVQWAAVTNYQWIRWVGTNPVEAILVNASGGVTGRVMRYSGADYIVAP